MSVAFVATAVSSRKPKKLLARMLFCILAPKEQSHDQTQNADSCHHSQDGWNAEFTF
jgi:hypothetical protein